MTKLYTMSGVCFQIIIVLDCCLLQKKLGRARKDSPHLTAFLGRIPHILLPCKCSASSLEV